MPASARIKNMARKEEDARIFPLSLSLCNLAQKFLCNRSAG